MASTCMCGGDNFPKPHGLSPASPPISSSSSSSSTAAAASRYWEEEKLETELAKVHGLIAVEMATGWSMCPIGDARRHISAELAAVVPESLTEEAAAVDAAVEQRTAARSPPTSTPSCVASH
uniref:Uncharacterized protein n=1 Tax=Oryza sativa subsp. japonica TaxID=39947 RepID=Q5VMI3_ORYSJ|nr:hypothetical protein [Oryza sativa Japonica Group]BAD69342.1 hypothetical protein [Oryza sativa Japonica Group]